MQAACEKANIPLALRRQPDGGFQFPARLIAGGHQPAVLIATRSIDSTPQAGAHQFEVEHRDFRRIGANRC